MSIKRACIYCRGPDGLASQAGFAAAYIVGLGLRCTNIYVDEQGFDSWQKIAEECARGNINAVIIKNIDVLTEDENGIESLEEILPISIIGAEDSYCSKENLDIETLQYEKPSTGRRENSKEDADKVRKWSTQSREAALWYQHEEIGYNYRISNIVAGVIRGQIPYLDEHIEQKREIYERYKEGLKDLPVKMNPCDEEKSSPNFWLSCLIIDSDAMTPHVRGEQDELWKHEEGKSSPGEILAAISAFGAEGRPIWKPMHMQPIYRMNPFVTVEGNGRGRSNAYIVWSGVDVGADIFRRGLCLPSDNKMTTEQQDRIIEIIHRCFL